eukprot:6046590-Alexandrium_andersonii.AAC.1
MFGGPTDGLSSPGLQSGAVDYQAGRGQQKQVRGRAGGQTGGVSGAGACWCNVCMLSGVGAGAGAGVVVGVGTGVSAGAGA